MIVDVLLTADETRQNRVKGKTAIVIDVLRASSTIVTALAHGCVGIIPAANPEEAIDLASILDDDEVLLGGEGNGINLKGFHLGNSPAEYTKAKVRGKKIILSTTNGTKAIKLGGMARDTLVGCLLNASAVVDKAANTGRDLMIICAGTGGKFSLEDTIAAGLIIDLIKKKLPSVTLTATAITAHHIYYNYRHTLLYPLQTSVNGRNLTRLGYASDIVYCAQVNKLNLVPRYSEGLIRLNQT